MGILGGILKDLISPVTDLVSEVVVDKDKARELNIRLKELADKADERYHEELMGQIEVNKVEAAHASVFVAGWRPFIGWVGGVGLAYTFILSPFIDIFVDEMPVLESSQLMTLVMALLGVGAMRSFDKVNGVSRDSLKTRTAIPVDPETGEAEVVAPPAPPAAKRRRRR